MTASIDGAFFCVSRVTDLSLKQSLHPPQPPTPPRQLLPRFYHHLSVRPLCLPTATVSRRRPYAAISCLVSGVGGGGVSDEFVSTRYSGLDYGLSVIANMLKRIEPLDTSVISKGVSDSAKDSMKQTISTMLGLLPSDQFSVTVRVSKRPLDRLLVSSIITGYTLWNAEYRISLMRNFVISPGSSEELNFYDMNEALEAKSKGGDGESGIQGRVEAVDRKNFHNHGDMSPEALNCIQQLESELFSVKRELCALKQENMKMEYMRESNNDLLEYLRSLESEMVIELSRPSSLEVEEIIHQLARNILTRFFKDDISSDFDGDSAMYDTKSLQNSDEEFSGDTIGTSRDYLAKLLFWCMLLGHHMRGLENRLQLSCFVGLL